MTENQVQEFILAEVRHILGDDHVAPGTKLLERFDELDLSDFVMGLEDEFSTTFGEEFYNKETCPCATPREFKDYVMENADV
ncbi:TPA: hypothetical protein ACH1LG_004887 [Salmonella enterica]|uniref:Uncharacterized protein n=3 Tax=root TaxID=1 RepID=A0A8S5UIU0_9CAUD|nr:MULTISPECIES: hypothetical protein [Enterococcus]ELG7156266.1 hypothetical protein [Staphylococcus aureus]DAF94347.1 MAG TPA: Protein of unknown function (DUF1493) [Myoviridae sp. ctu2j3]HDH7443286.1 hypothetical protein [Escherichia coli]ELL1201143.1 hypothetical protein [Staphylococcus aureus]MDN3040580.1 hypothetical protein [Enterococcus faecium]